jgi:N-terminal 7TM region of histidine kinase
MSNLIVNTLHTLNSLLTAGIAITAFSLLLYVLSFNLRDRVTRSLAIILSCVVIVFIAEALSSIANAPGSLEFFLRLQWVGIIFLPAAYMQFSDALLSTTGRPSRGRRRLAVRLGYFISLGFLILLPSNLLVGSLRPDGSPAPHLQRTTLTWIFASYYVVAMVIAWSNFVRAYRRTVTSTSRRRMTYLLVGALAPALGSYPYLLFGSSLAAYSPLLFWLAVTLSNMLTSVFLVVMAYSVAFFGIPWPDRVVKRRLFKWLMRGPVTASTVLAITTFTRRAGAALGFDLTAIMPAIMAGSIVILEHLITLASPYWERKLFYGSDRADLDLIQALDERLLTEGDLRQFLEAILAAMCDRLQTSKAFAAVFDTHGIEIYIAIGGGHPLEVEELPGQLLQAAAQNGVDRDLFEWGEFWLLPVFSNRENGNRHLLGLLGVMRHPDTNLDAEQREALDILSQRAELAINDRFRQQQAFRSLEELTPQMDMIQRLRAASSYDRAQILSEPDPTLQMARLSPWVKDALTHYWGGPKLTQNPLLNLQIVQQTAHEHEDNPTNALRAILRKAIEDVRPEGERRFTAEWILYNILEMKFMEGRKVREIAMRLALSEADLYRKQRVAIEAVANAILEMEQQARLGVPVAMENTINIKTPSKRE